MSKNIEKPAVTETETVFIPRVSGEDPCVFVGLNGRSWQVPRGQKVEVPKPVAAIIAESERSARYAEAYASAAKCGD